MPPRLPLRVALPRLTARPSTVLPLRPTLPQSSTIRLVHSGWLTRPSRQRHTRFNQVTEGIPALTTGPAAALARREKTTPWRTGVLVTKKGMTAVYEGKNRIPCTVLQLDQVQVVNNKTREKNGYWAVQIGRGSKDPKNIAAPQLGYYENKGIPPKAELAEFYVKDESGLLPVGVQLLPDWFQIGQYVDVKGNSRGMGFAGGMKRHGFSGQEASHGNSKNHRTIGSAGQSQGGGSRVYPGKKMPGRMGNESVTVQNLRVMAVDNELGTVIVSGPVPGPNGRTLKLQDSKKRKPPGAPFREQMKKELLERHSDWEEKLHYARLAHSQMKLQRQPLLEPREL